MRRVGWIRIGALGDLLVGLASLRETLEAWPDAKVSVVGSKLWLQLIEPGFWPQIDRLVIVEKRGTVAEIYELGAAPSPLTWEKVATRKLRVELKSCNVVFNSRVDSPRQGFAALWARVPERWGSAEGLARFIYNRRAPHDGKDPLIHERDVPLLLMDEAEAGFKGDAMFHRASLQERVALSPRIQKWREVGLPAPRRFDRGVVRESLGIGKYFVVNPTSSRREKAWPTKNFRHLLRRLRGHQVFGSMTPLIVGAPNETNWLREVAEGEFQMHQPASLADLYNVISGAEFLVTNTSSVQFIAASVGTKTLTLMGRAKPEIWGPLGPKDHYVLGVEPKGVDSIFERELKAYESISVDAVFAELSSWVHDG